MFDFLSWFGSKVFKDGVQFAAELRVVLQQTHEAGRLLRSPSIGTEHIVLAVLSSPQSEASLILSSLGVRATELRSYLEGEIGQHVVSGARRHRSSPSPSWSKTAKQAIIGAVGEARKLSHTPVSSGHLLQALLKDTGSVAGKALAERGVGAAEVRAVLKQGVSDTAELDIRLDDRSDRLIYEQIVAQIQEASATGRLLAGQRLPPIRQLADQLEVAPGTVARAYGQLESAGTVVTDRARGTFVSGPGQAAPGARHVEIRALLRPAVVAAFHLGSSADELRAALAEAMADIYAGGA